MKTAFKCVHTGQVYLFEDHDLADMRRHADYVEVKEEEKKPEAKVTAKKSEAKDE